MDLLDQLAKLRADAEEVMIEKEKAIRALIPAEIRAELNQVEEAFTERFEALRAEMDLLENDIRRQALAKGETVKGQRMLAVYSPGRASWDDKGLQGYAVAHPEVLAFRKEGKASVSIREK